jgi:diguanylate cyclase (GGDEF)-like protein
MTDKKDIIGRFGGDEFVIILMEKGLDQAVNIGQTILEYLWKSPIAIENQEIYTTISLGVTDNIIGNPKNAEDMIRIADKALYQAKNNGRNQLCVAWKQQKDYDY